MDCNNNLLIALNGLDLAFQNDDVFDAPTAYDAVAHQYMHIYTENLEQQMDYFWSCTVLNTETNTEMDCAEMMQYMYDNNFYVRETFGDEVFFWLKVLYFEWHAWSRLHNRWDFMFHRNIGSICDRVEALQVKYTKYGLLERSKCEQCADPDWYGKCDDFYCSLERQIGVDFFFGLYAWECELPFGRFENVARYLYSNFGDRYFAYGPYVLDLNTWKIHRLRRSLLSDYDTESDSDSGPDYSDDDDDDDQQPRNVNLVSNFHGYDETDGYNRMEFSSNPNFANGPPSGARQAIASGLEEEILEELNRPTSSSFSSLPDKIVEQTFKISKIHIQKKKRKAERQLNHLLHKYKFKTERQRMRDRKMEDAEASGLLGGLAHLFEAGKEFLGYDAWKPAIDEWISLAAGLLAAPNIKGVVASFANLARILGISISEAMKQMFTTMKEILKSSFTTLRSGVSQQSQAPSMEAEACGNLEFLFDFENHWKKADDLKNFFSSKGLDPFALTLTAVAGAAVTFATYILGTRPDSHKNVSFWSKIVLASSNIAKLKSGAYSYISIIKDFVTWTYSFLEGTVMSDPDSSLIQIIRNLDIEDDGEDLQKCKFFDYYKYLTNPSKAQQAMTNTLWRKRLLFVDSIFKEVTTRLSSSEPDQRSQQILRNVSLMSKTIESLAKTSYKINLESNIRPRPVVFSFVGAPGVGKSVFQTYFVNTVLTTLQRCSKFGVPSSVSDRVCTVNFSDPYLTGYKGQYCLCIDDLFQDRDGAIDGTSSALQLISWVSNAPYSTKQAALDEKGILFTSRMIVASSNVAEPSSNAIQSNEALIRRMDFQVRFIPDESAEPQSALGGKRVRLDLYQPRYTGETWKLEKVKTFKNTNELMRDAIKFYIKQFDHEEVVAKCTQANSDIVQELYDECLAEPSGLLEYFTKQTQPDWEKLTPCEYTQRIKDANLSELLDLQQLKTHVQTYGDLYSVCLLRGWIEVNLDDSLGFGPKFSEIENRGLDQIVVQMMSGFNSALELSSTAAELYLMTQRIIEDDVWIKYETRWQERIKNFLRSNAGKILLTIAAGIGALALYKLAVSPGKEEQQPSGLAYANTKPMRTPKVRIARNAFASGDIYPDETDPQLNDIVNSIQTRQNLVSIFYRYSLAGEPMAYSQGALRVVGNLIVTNHHFFSTMRELGVDRFSIKYPAGQATKVQEEIFDDRFMLAIPGKDIAFYALSAAGCSAKDITSYFPTEGTTLPETIPVKVMVSPRRNAVVSTLREGSLHAKYTDVGAHYSAGGENYQLRSCWFLDTQSERGDSGSLLLARSRRTPFKILGIQSAISRNRPGAWFESLVQEEILYAVDRLKINKNKPVEFADASALLECTEVTKDLKIGTHNLWVIGEVPRKVALTTSTKTKLRKSLVYDPQNSKTQPSVLNKNDERLRVPVADMYAHNMQGYDAPVGPIDRGILGEAVEELTSYLRTAYRQPNIEPRLLNDDEMINGIPGIMESVAMETSPGYPWVKQRTNPHLNGKFEWFEESTAQDGRKLYQMKDALSSRLEQRESEARKGNRLSDSFGYTCLKDEKRKHEKIASGKTRVFICLPMDYNLLVRKYFGAFTASQHVVAAKPGIPSCVGINPLESWETIYRDLCSKNSLWEDFDYANWDQSLHPEFLSAYADIVSAFYGDKKDSENHKVRQVLMDELCRTFLLMGNHLVYKNTGICSGCAITAEINCVIHELLLLYSYKTFHGRLGEKKTLNDFLDNIAIKVYGDDIIFASAEDENGFHGQQHREIAEELGMRITTAQKDLNFREKLPEQCTFLKRSFVVSKALQKMVCPISKEVIEEIPQWIHSADSDLDATIVNANCALQEAFLHGKDYYNDLRQRLVDRLSKYTYTAGGSLYFYEHFLAAYLKGDYVLIAIRSSNNE